MKALKTFIAIIFVFAVSTFSYAQTNTPKPDLPNVTYGDYDRNVLVCENHKKPGGAKRDMISPKVTTFFIDLF